MRQPQVESTGLQSLTRPDLHAIGGPAASRPDPGEAAQQAEIW